MAKSTGGEAPGSLTILATGDPESGFTIWRGDGSIRTNNELRRSDMGISANLGEFFNAVSAAEEACMLAQAGKIDDAMALFDRAIKLCQATDYLGNFHIMRGAARMEECQIEAALADFNFAIETDCTYPNEAYRRRGNALASLGRCEAALSDFRRALEEGEDPAYGHERIVGMLVALGRDDEAMQEPFEDIDGAADAQRRLLLCHAELCLLHGKPEAAEACVEKAEQIEDADDSELGLWRAVLRKRLGLVPETAAIRKAVEDWPDSNAARLYALLVDGQGEPADAFDRFSESDRPNSRAVIRCVLRYFAGSWCEAEGDAASAAAHYKSAISDLDARWAMEFSLARRGFARLSTASSGAEVEDPGGFTARHVGTVGS
jgi:tetratricopeptide (TPR) repeat protein